MNTQNKSDGKLAWRLALTVMTIPLVTTAALIGITLSNTAAYEGNIANSVDSDVRNTANAVNQFVAANPAATDVSAVMPTVTGTNKVIAFGSAADFVVCGYNEAGSTDYFKYTSVTGEFTGANGSEAGLCGEQSQTLTSPTFVTGSSDPVTIGAPVDTVSGSGGALATAGEVN
ncbi:hypothetical protein ACVLV4_000447 [Rathayibacter agropyri]